VRPGPNNALTDVAGLRVGHARVPGALSGTTVVLAAAAGAVAGVDVRGAVEHRARRADPALEPAHRRRIFRALSDRICAPMSSVLAQAG